MPKTYDISKSQNKKKGYATTLDVTFLFQKYENICQKEKRRKFNFASELYGCKKNVNCFINKKLLLKKLDFMKMWFWEKFSHIAL